MSANLLLVIFLWGMYASECDRTSLFTCVRVYVNVSKCGYVCAWVCASGSWVAPPNLIVDWTGETGKQSDSIQTTQNQQHLLVLSAKGHWDSSSTVQQDGQCFSSITEQFFEMAEFLAQILMKWQFCHNKSLHNNNNDNNNNINNDMYVNT